MSKRNYVVIRLDSYKQHVMSVQSAIMRAELLLPLHLNLFRLMPRPSDTRYFLVITRLHMESIYYGLLHPCAQKHIWMEGDLETGKMYILFA